MNRIPIAVLPQIIQKIDWKILLNRKARWIQWSQELQWRIPKNWKPPSEPGRIAGQSEIGGRQQEQFNSQKGKEGAVQIVREHHQEIHQEYFACASGGVKPATSNNHGLWRWITKVLNIIFTMRDPKYNRRKVHYNSNFFKSRKLKSTLSCSQSPKMPKLTRLFSRPSNNNRRLWRRTYNWIRLIDCLHQSQQPNNSRRQLESTTL